MIEQDESRMVLWSLLRSYRESATLHAICEDYRVSASINLEHNQADQGNRIDAPLLAIWGEQSVVGEFYDVKGTWQKKATRASGAAIPCGHAIPEEVPAELAAQILRFLVA